MGERAAVQPLGKGGYGEVMAVRNRTTGHPFAMKIVKYGHGIDMAGMNFSAKQEIGILSSCSHVRATFTASVELSHTPTGSHREND